MSSVVLADPARAAKTDWGIYLPQVPPTQRHSNFVVRSKAGTSARGPVLLSMYSLHAGWRAAPGKAQLMFGKTMWQDVQAIAKILSSCRKENIFLQAP